MKTRLDDVRWEKVTHLEGDKNYTILHFSDGSQYVSAYTLKRYETFLHTDPAFRRVHRKFLVNVTHVSANARDHVHLRGGLVLPVSRRRRAG